ncbi:hypothetical protein KGM_214734 [Danaus plexippus plexippus]|uniref:Uncharacterized protein n=1 Tax=Danaus plexippus plexippus TaxID=278856 RepID=A0A212FPW0_DANPL|nr:hypothetical protein KGM_214734 [Danaus plexippus plexippus]
MRNTQQYYKDNSYKMRAPCKYDVNSCVLIISSEHDARNQYLTMDIPIFTIHLPDYMNSDSDIS